MVVADDHSIRWPEASPHLSITVLYLHKVLANPAPRLHTHTGEQQASRGRGQLALTTGWRGRSELGSEPCKATA